MGLDILEIIIDSVSDSVKLIPFLFLTYLVMEYLEHKTGEGARRLIMRLGRNGRRKFGRVDSVKGMQAQSIRNLGGMERNQEGTGRTQAEISGNQEGTGRTQAEISGNQEGTGRTQAEISGNQEGTGRTQAEIGRNQEGTGRTQVETSKSQEAFERVQAGMSGRPMEIITADGNLAGNGQGRIGKIGAGPVVGGLLGVVPQCGFSAAASNLYAGRVITLGTLMAIYLSTSDEMLPLLLSERAPLELIMGILLAKAAVGMVAGLGIDFLQGREGAREQGGIHDICEQENCHCENGIFRSALSHTFQIAFFIFVVTFALNLVLYYVGEGMLASLILNRPVLAPVLAGVVGLIPNCAGSVVLTQLYLKGAMGLGALMAGLFANSGVGLLVLFRVNHDRKENLKILGMLYGIGVAAGIIMGFVV